MPSPVTAKATVSGLMSLIALLAWGKSTFTEWVSTGTVIIKIISSTNITSTRGVMLISLITSLSSSSPPPKAISVTLFVGFAIVEPGDGRGLAAGGRRTGNKVGVQLMCKTVELAEYALVAAIERVVTQHGGNGHGQTKGSHDQCLAHRACDFIDTGRAGYTDAHQRVINPPHGAEQANKGCGGTHRRQNGQAPLQALGALVDTAAQTGGQPIRQR